MKRFPAIDVDNDQSGVDRTASMTIDLTLDSDEDDPDVSSRFQPDIQPPNHRTYAGTGMPALLASGQSKRKRPGASVFVAWPPSTSSGKQSVIVLDDSENEQGWSSPYKKPRPDEEDAFVDDNDEDYDGCHDGFTENSSRWKPFPDVKREYWEEDGGDNTDNKFMEVEMSEVLEMLSVEAALRPAESRRRRRIRPNVPNISMRKPFFPIKQFAIGMEWNKAGHGVANWQRLYRANDIYNSPLPNTRTRGRFMMLGGVHGQELSRTSSFKHSPGWIVRIIQQEGCAVICSVCLGGNPDDEEDTISAYTRDGALIVWHDGVDDIMTGHRRRIADRPDDSEVYKHYSVNDVKFDPTGTSFVSSGNDKKVRVWVKEDDGDGDDYDYVQDRILSYSHVPHEIAFKPGTKKLAVAERKIVVHADYESSVARSNLELSPASADHCVGNMIWGFGPTERYICASSEPMDESHLEGYHKLFDVERGVAYDLDSREAGDSLALMPDGATLVHTSRGPNGKHILRLYDVKRKNGFPVETVHMESFPPDVEGETNSISISPDGIYVAIARIDNRVHVYDSRNIKKGKLYQYEHTGPSLVLPGTDSCGVPCTRWAETEYGRLTLISGGIDGYVRLWNPLEAITSPKNGIILAQVNADISYFNLGDRTKGEQQLIVGDMHGEVTIFNSTKAYFWPL